jgi:hypothetical protein
MADATGSRRGSSPTSGRAAAGGDMKGSDAARTTVAAVHVFASIASREWRGGLREA